MLTVFDIYCSGSDRVHGVCKDGSDQAYCLHTIYTGSFLNTTLGLREYFSISKIWDIILIENENLCKMSWNKKFEKCLN